ncbi:MAG: aa3-type cytochrome oxidase subunit II [Acidimicrobiia bacterium]
MGSQATRWRGRPAGPLVFLAALVALISAGCDADFGAYRGETEQGSDIFQLWQGAVIAAIVVGAIVWGLIFFAIFQYRRRRHDDSGALPSQRQYMLPLEVSYTIVPIMMVAVLFGFAYATQRNVDDLDPNPDMEIVVQGFQWQWQFHYPDQDVVVTGFPNEPPTLVLPTDETIRVHTESRDVIHSFYVSEFNFKRDTIPGSPTEFDLTIDEAGTYRGQCAEFCGLDHARMTFTVEAVSPSEFQAWVKDVQDDPDNEEAGS